MFRKLLILPFVVCSLVNVLADDDIPQLSDDEFESSIKQYETSLIMFYAPWYVLNSYRVATTSSVDN